MKKDAQLTWHSHPVNQTIRTDMKGQKPFVLWLTGLSGSGKSTLAGEVERLLTHQHKHTYLLDGDNVRRGLCSDLAFSHEDRTENIRRISEVSRLMLDAGLIVLAAFISPKQSQRALAREMFQEHELIEVFVDTPLEECEKRDVKGLYHKARSGEVKGFTGIDAVYEVPLNPDIHIQGGTVEKQAVLLMKYLYKNGYLER